MNSQFKNSNLGFILYAFLISIIVIATIVIFWYMFKGYRMNTYSEDTLLGSVYIGGLKEADVEPLLYDRIDRWLNDETIVFEVNYQGYSYTIDREMFYFDLGTSIDLIQNSQTNRLLVTFQGTDLQDMLADIKDQPYLLGMDQVFDYDQLILDIIDDAELMKSYSSKDLEDYFIDTDSMYEVINTVNMIVPEGVSIDNMIADITAIYSNGYIDIESKQLFDIIDKFGAEFNDTELKILSSSIMELSLATNFQINEVHYLTNFSLSSYTIDTFPYFGHNVHISEIEQDSFSIYNPNVVSYYIIVEKVSNELATVSLYGLPFINQITVDLQKTIIPYVTETTTDDLQIRDGEDGAVVIVNRLITDIYDNEIYNEDIVFEFYSPSNKVILKP